MSSNRLVAVIPAGNTIDATVAAMNAMQAVHTKALQLTNNPDTGDMLVLLPTAAQEAAHVKADIPSVVRTAKKVAKKAAAAEAARAASVSITMGTGEPGTESALAVAFRSDSSGIPVIADWAAAILDEHEAHNFITFTFANPDGERYALTVQRVDGQSPADKIADLTARLEAVTRHPRA